jgi:lipoprotein-releasing system permease protein
MPFEWSVAKRYLWAARKERHTAFLSFISMLGLAVGVATLIVSLALLSGLQGQIKGRLIASSPQLLVEPAGGNTIVDSDALAAAARARGVRKVTPIVSGIAWGANAGEKRGRPLRIRSYDPATPPPADDPRASSRLFEKPYGVMMTRDSAAALGLNAGEDVTLVSPRRRLTPFGPVPVWRRYRIVRIVAPGSDERAAEAFLPFPEASTFFGTDDKPTSMEMSGAPADRAESIQSELIAQFPRAQLKTWKEINRPLFLALRLEKVVMFVTISLIIFVAALNLISSLSMLIVEKRPQVGVLRTLGASERSILLIFLGVGLLIGLSGTLAGNLIGLGVAWAANQFHLIPLPRDIYFISYLPFSIDGSDVLGVNGVAILLSILATWYPARIASRLEPVTAIRDE